MYRKLLNQFFKENGVKDPESPSAAAMMSFSIKMQLAPEADDMFNAIADEVIGKEQPMRLKTVEMEKKEIEAANCGQLIRFMRAKPDVINCSSIVKRALLFEDELVPEIIRRLRTSQNTGFIEVAARILAVCGKDVSTELVGYYDDVRSPYAQSVILLVLGFKGDETHIPWLIKKYDEMQRFYPEESYSDGAFYALSELESRFYP